MRKALLHTFLAMVITAAIIILIVLLTAGQGTGILIVALFMFIFCGPFPTYLAVLFYIFGAKKKFPNNMFHASLYFALLLLFLYHFFFVLFAVVINEEPWSYLTNRLIIDYKDEFAVPTILTVLVIISIPLADLLIEKIKRDLKDFK